MTLNTTTHARRGGLLAACLALVLAAALALPGAAHAVRLKDLASFSGERNNSLVGYGLVIGLSGTGDKSGGSYDFTIQSMVSMLENMGVSVDRTQLKPKNVAAVMVTAKMPVSATPGSRLDVTVSSLNNAQSLLGGVLMMTPLRGVDGKVYALAQGALALGAISVSGAAAATQKNIATVGSIPNGATVERSVPFKFNDQGELRLHMNNPDFSTTMEVVKAINDTLGQDFARADDAATVRMAIPQEFRGNLVPLMASLENLEIAPDTKAKIVVDEKTGTVVLGRNVRLSKVAVAHGSLQIVVTESQNVSQPGALSGGTTQSSAQTDIGLKEERRRLLLMEGATLQELVDGLNSIGATPRDLISILKTMKSAGALHAELEVI